MSVIGIREARRRHARLLATIGAQIVELRNELGLSQAALAAGAGVDQGHLSRIERGLEAASLRSLIAIATCLGADLGVRLFSGGGPRIRDHLQAPMIEALLAQLDRRWQATPELPVPGARGVIDAALRLRGGSLAIAVEAHSELRSVDLVLRRLREKTLALAEIEGPSSAASSVLLLRSTTRTRELVRLHHATFAAAFPGECRIAIAALVGSSSAWPGSSLLWVRLERGRGELLLAPPRGIRLGR